MQRFNIILMNELVIIIIQKTHFVLKELIILFVRIPIKRIAREGRKPIM